MPTMELLTSATQETRTSLRNGGPKEVPPCTPRYHIAGKFEEVLQFSPHDAERRKVARFTIVEIPSGRVAGKTDKFLFVSFAKVCTKHSSKDQLIDYFISLIQPAKKQHRSGVWLSERLASLGIMGRQLWVPLKIVWPTQSYRIEGLKRGPQLCPHYAERRCFLRQRMWVLFQSGGLFYSQWRRLFISIDKIFLFRHQTSVSWLPFLSRNSILMWMEF